jgi:hypothetical protein
MQTLDMQTKTTRVQALDQVVRWRREQLEESGFAPALAARVAENTHYDLHALIELVERGCPRELALRILAPLEGQSEA